VKTINLFYCERCGDAIPGIHDVCHGDWRCAHGDRNIVINGGWHDAGDLSQGLVNTSEAVVAMFLLAKRVQATDPELAQRLIVEAVWGSIGFSSAGSATAHVARGPQWIFGRRSGRHGR